MGLSPVPTARTMGGHVRGAVLPAPPHSPSDLAAQHQLSDYFAIVFVLRPELERVVRSFLLGLYMVSGKATCKLSF